MYVTASENGTIYYTVRTEGDDWGIVKSCFVNGRYTEPEILEGGSNSPYYDAHPCIARDESYIIFDSKRPGATGGEGDIDLYICFKNREDLWGEALTIGSTINTSKQDHVAYLSPHGKYIFYAFGERDQWDIYWVDAKIIEKLKPDYLK